ncbi:hypothetical protein [Streptomyces sp. NBC_01727]|uniref:hypothetical protein n=1 Tax=Streptomyces sp. NBC_01727 TaxID=2975924 RepID=UPI002E0ED61A|nr:hypothetical protein OIE76_43780 [Streptomyces sp. NBC_01727]
MHEAEAEDGSTPQENAELKETLSAVVSNLGMSQNKVAKAISVDPGHFSKCVNVKAIISDQILTSLLKFVKEENGTAAADEARGRLVPLVEAARAARGITATHLDDAEAALAALAALAARAGQQDTADLKRQLDDLTTQIGSISAELDHARADSARKGTQIVEDERRLNDLAEQLRAARDEAMRTNRSVAIAAAVATVIAEQRQPRPPTNGLVELQARRRQILSGSYDDEDGNDEPDEPPNTLYYKNTRGEYRPVIVADQEEDYEPQPLPAPPPPLRKRKWPGCLTWVVLIFVVLWLIGLLNTTR